MTTVAGAVLAVASVVALFVRESARLIGEPQWQRRAGLAAIPVVLLFLGVVVARFVALL